VTLETICRLGKNETTSANGSYAMDHYAGQQDFQNSSRNSCHHSTRNKPAEKGKFVFFVENCDKTVVVFIY